MKVLDASAVTAFLLDEPGADQARAALPSGRLSVVNLCEILMRIARDGVAPDVTLEKVRDTGLQFVDVTLSQASNAAKLHDRKGLSLGDRMCIALGQELRVPVVTSDRLWAQLELPVAVELIR